MFESYKLKVNWDQDLPKYWFDNSPFKTHFMNSLSTRFIYGEKFFIDTMKLFQNSISDANLKETVDQFIAQEVYHRAVHKQYDSWLEKQGYPVEYIETLSQEQVKKVKDKKLALLMTACLEHLTSVFAEYFLKHPTILDQMHPHFRKVWQWHAIEELEHKAVAVDLINYMNYNKLSKRFFSLVLTTIIFFRLLQGTIILLKHDKKLLTWKTLKDAMQFFFSLRTGFLIYTIVPYLRIMKPSFHPNNVDHSVLLSRYQK